MRRGSPRPSNTMNKIFCHFGHVVIDYMRHVGHVDAARGYISCNQHPVVALRKTPQSLVPLGLRTVTVNLRCRMP